MSCLTLIDIFFYRLIAFDSFIIYTDCNEALQFLLDLSYPFAAYFFDLNSAISISNNFFSIT